MALRMTRYRGRVTGLAGARSAPSTSWPPGGAYDGLDAPVPRVRCCAGRGCIPRI